MRSFELAFALALVPQLAAGPPGPYRIETVAGSSFVGDGGPAPAAALRDAESVSFDVAGALYVADAGDHRVRKITPDSVITTVAGSGFPALTGDNGQATNAQLNLPYGVVSDHSGNLFIADLGNGRVRRVSPDGAIATVVSGLASPRNLALDSQGSLYIAEFGGNRISRLNGDGSLTTIAGTGAAGADGDGGFASLAKINAPAGMAFDRTGNLYFADSGNHKVRRIANGIISTVLGNGAAGSSSPNQLYSPTGVAVDATGTLYVADSGNARIRRLTSAGAISSLAIAAKDVAIDSSGNLVAAAGAYVYKMLPNSAVVTLAGDGSYLFRGDNGPATSARLNGAFGVALDGAGTLWISDLGNGRIRQVAPSGIIATTAGPVGLTGPGGIALDFDGTLLIADITASWVRRLSGLTLTTAAGTKIPGYNGEGFPAASSALNLPNAVAPAPGGILYIADTGNHRIRRVNASGALITVAGAGTRGWNGDGPATATLLDSPSALVLDPAGNVYFTEMGNNRVRKLTPDGQILTLPVDGLKAPRGIARDRSGTLYIADTGNHRVLVLAPDGSVSVIAGTGSPGFTGDGAAASAQLSSPTGLAVDDATGSVYVADYGNSRVRRLVPATPPVSESGPMSLAVVNAATLAAGAVAPCSVVSLFGSGLDGAQIQFDGQTVAAISAVSSQANVQVPCSTSGQRTTTVDAIGSQGSLGRFVLPLVPAAPGIFTYGSGTGQAAATNQDGSLNSADNPAARGSIVSLFATGLAASDAIGVLVGSMNAPVQFAGDAPGLLGISQINAQLPPMATGVQPIQVFSGFTASRPGVTLAVR